jgi:protein-arginine kinase activator protein McsA
VVNALQKELDYSIKEQDFERAAILRDDIKNLTKNKSKVADLQKELEKVIQEQNFERAIEIRDELKKIN